MEMNNVQVARHYISKSVVYYTTLRLFKVNKCPLSEYSLYRVIAEP